MTEPLVSVKMLTYNHAPYIAQAIESVLMQKTTFPFELVIGEDCSTDGTREIVFDYARRYPEIIRVVTSDKNVGALQNSVRCSRVLRGKYIAWCEGDDYWHRDDKLQLQVDYLETHPECGLVYSDYDQYDVKSQKYIKNYLKRTKVQIPLSPTIEHILTGKAGILTCTVVARKDIVLERIHSDSHLYQSGYYKMGDTPLWAEISLRSGIFRFEESLATHQILLESATQSQDPTKALRFWISNSEMCLYLCDKYQLPDHIKRLHTRNIRGHYLKLAFYQKSAELAKQTLEKYDRFTMRDWGWYWATIHPLFRSFAWRFLAKKN